MHQRPPRNFSAAPLGVSFEALGIQAFIFCWTLLIATPASAQDLAVTDAGVLEVGSTQEAELRVGTAHRWLLPGLGERDWIEVTLESGSPEVEMEVVAPQGRSIDVVRDSTGTGTATFWVVAVPGDWTVDVSTNQADGAASYAVTWSGQRAATVEEAEADDVGRGRRTLRLFRAAVRANDAGRFARAERRYLPALEGIEVLLGPVHPNLSRALASLATMYSIQRRFEEAEPLFIRTIAILAEVFGPDHSTVGAGEFSLGAMYSSAQRYYEAETHLLRALEIQKAGEGPAGRDVAQTLNSLADVYNRLARYDDAERAFARILTILEADPGETALPVARVRNNLGATLHHLGRHAEAEEQYDRALEVQLELQGPDHVEVAILLSLLAGVYLDQGRLAEAESFRTRALRIDEAVFDPDHTQLAIRHSGLAQVLRTQGRYEEAESHYLRALRIYEAALGPDNLEVARALSGLAANDMAQGFLVEAEARYLKAQAIEVAVLGPNHPTVAGSHSSLAQLYEQQGRLSDAEEGYLQAQEIYEDVLGSNVVNLLSPLTGLAALRGVAGRYDESEALYLRALEISEAVYGPSNVAVATTLNGLGVLYRGQGRLADADELLVRALEIRRQSLGDDHPDVAQALLNLAVVANDASDFAGAEERTREAIEIVDREGGWPGLEIASWWALGVSLNGQQDNRGAIRALETAIDVIEDARASFGSDEEVRADFMASYDDIFDFLIKLQLRDGGVGEAFSTAQRSRTRAMLDQLAAGKIDMREGIDPEVRRGLERRETTALAAIAEYQQRITLTRADGSTGETERLDLVEALQTSLREADETYRQVYREIQGASWLWQDLLTAGGQPVSIRTLQDRVIPRDGALLMYHLGVAGSTLFFVPERGDVEAYPLVLTPEAAAYLGQKPGPLTEAVLAEILGSGGGGESARVIPSSPLTRSREIGGGASAHPTELRHALWTALVPPAAWARISEAPEVIVVPQGGLNHIPFEALVTSLDDDVPRYWLDDGPVVRYSASATVLYNIERRPSARSAGLVGVGRVLTLSDPVYDPTEVARRAGTSAALARPDLLSVGRATRESFERGAGSLASLPGTARETEAILEVFGSDAASGSVTVLQGLDAGEPELREALGGARYVHLATHGLVDQRRSSLFASLALTPPAGETADSRDDGFLQLHEIYRLRMPGVELAVLSACDTNVGDNIEGEGVFALSRGFLVAGAERVIASQWSVNDDSTAALMGQLFKAIAEDEQGGRAVDYAQALRKAQLAVRDDPEHPEWADPYYWAPFVLSGKR